MDKKPTAHWNPKDYKPLTEAQIREAIAHTKSNAAAARYLNASMKRYKKYAEIFGLYEQHNNKIGKGIAKGFSSRPSSIPLKDIFDNQHPGYSMVRLKYRLLASKMLPEECSMCQFSERRLTDGKTPLLLTFKNGVKDYRQDNLILMCYNCLFLTTGSPSVAARGYIQRSLTQPDTIPQKWQINPRAGDAEPEDADTSQMYKDIRQEVLDELGNTL